MNTIPTIFNEKQVNSTILGGVLPVNDAKIDVSVIMLNVSEECSGSHLRIQSLENLLALGFKRIVWVETAKNSYSIEDMSRRYPTVKFVIPQEKTNRGQLINMCVDVIDSEYFLVLNDYLKITPTVLTQNLAENLIKQKKYCIVPRLYERTGENILVNVVPEAVKGKFLLTPTQFIADNIPTLFPCDFIGLYNRKKFIQLGGFDYTLSSAYWQNADLSLRAWLWGEKITVSTSFVLNYAIEKEISDTTCDYSYLRFYLKNLLPVYKDDHGMIKSSAFLNFKSHSKCGFFEGYSLFKNAQKWVAMNKYRYKMDVRTLIEKWGSEK